MNEEKDLLLPEEIDQFNLSILPEIPPQFLLRKDLKVLDIANVHVPRRTRMYSHRHRGRKRS